MVECRGFPQPDQDKFCLQEHTNSSSMKEDARVALLETAFVLITSEQGIPPVSDARRTAKKNGNQVHPSRSPIRKLGRTGRGGFVLEVLGKSPHVQELSIFLPGTSVLGSRIAREAQGEASP